MCITCDVSCVNCVGTTSNDCIRCPSGQYLYSNAITPNKGKCLSTACTKFFNEGGAHCYNGNYLFKIRWMPFRFVL